MNEADLPDFSPDWDTKDPIANVIEYLVRVQNRIQSLHNAGAYGPIAPDEALDEAYAARERAIDELTAARESFKQLREDGHY
jgi:hypothetical protein